MIAISPTDIHYLYNLHQVFCVPNIVKNLLKLDDLQYYPIISIEEIKNITNKHDEQYLKDALRLSQAYYVLSFIMHPEYDMKPAPPSFNQKIFFYELSYTWGVSLHSQSVNTIRQILKQFLHL
jgi:hypothetical protein